MRKIIFFICCVFVLNAAMMAQNVLVVQLTDQTEQTFDIGDNGSVALIEATSDMDGYISVVDNENNTSTILFSEIQKMYFKSALSINDIANTDNLFVYPNPAKDYIKTAGGKHGKQNVNIYSLDGKLLIQGKYADDEKIDISFLEKGMYVAKINNQTFKFSKL